MKSLFTVAGILAASITVAGATNYTDDTVGTINGNGKTILEATGNSLNATTFATDIATAFANNTGGVWDFDGTAFDVAPTETVTLKYGTSLANSLVLTLSGTNPINQGTIAGEATSGSTELGLAGDGSTRVFTPSKPLLTVGIFNTNRGAADRFPVLTVTFQDDTTASTSGANAGAVYFHGLSGTVANPIKSFSLSQNNFIRYDDLGFVVAPLLVQSAQFNGANFEVIVKNLAPSQTYVLKRSTDLISFPTLVQTIANPVTTTATFTDTTPPPVRAFYRVEEQP